MAIGIKVLGMGAHTILEVPEWVVEFDPDGGRYEYPTGTLVTDVDPSKALRFDNKVDAFTFVGQQSKNVPIRPDGRPNLPLTAFTIEITEIPTNNVEA